MQLPRRHEATAATDAAGAEFPQVGAVQPANPKPGELVEDNGCPGISARATDSSEGEARRYQIMFILTPG